jgi:hypothetical protein
MTSNEAKSANIKKNGKKDDKPKTMDELRKPGIENLPRDNDEFRIVSPGLHVPDGQDTHE